MKRLFRFIAPPLAGSFIGINAGAYLTHWGLAVAGAGPNPDAASMFALFFGVAGFFTGLWAALEQVDEE